MSLGWLGPLLSFLGNLTGLWGKQQDRVNAPKIVANVDAKRDRAEKEKIESTIKKSEETGNLDEERKQFAED